MTERSDLFVASAGASAALAGLVFVASSTAVLSAWTLLVEILR